MTAPSSPVTHLHPEAGLARRLLLSLLALVLLVGGAIWWFVLRDDAPPPAALGDCASPVTGDPPATPDGTWTLQSDAGADPEVVFVGYRIQERFGGETVTKTATGRTTEVEGSLVVDGGAVSEASVVAHLGSLSSNRTARDTSLRVKALETDQFPTATFTLTTPIALDPPSSVGVPVDATATGTLELHGQEQSIEVPVEACWTGLTIKLSGSAPIVLADYGIEQVQTPIVDIADHGELEFQLEFTPA